MKLIDRLQYMADEIRQGETVADIGTDHGFLPLYLLQTGKSPKVIMADVSAGSLAKAEENCRIFHAKGDYDLRLGSGLEVLENGEVDVAVFAGMGGQLIRELLAFDPKKTQSIKRFILQPRNKAGLLRLWLAENGMKIVKEGVVREGKFVCEILTVETGHEVNPGIEWSPEFDYPHMIIENGNEATSDYLRIKLDFEKRIYEGLLEGRDVPEARKQIARQKIEQLEKLMEEWEKQ